MNPTISSKTALLRLTNNNPLWPKRALYNLFISLAGFVVLLVAFIILSSESDKVETTQKATELVQGPIGIEHSDELSLPPKTVFWIIILIAACLDGFQIFSGIAHYFKAQKFVKEGLTEDQPFYYSAKDGYTPMSHGVFFNKHTPIRFIDRISDLWGLNALGNQNIYSFCNAVVTKNCVIEDIDGHVFLAITVYSDATYEEEIVLWRDVDNVPPAERNWFANNFSMGVPIRVLLKRETYDRRHIGMRDVVELHTRYLIVDYGEPV